MSEGTFWERARKASEEVAAWPEWKRKAVDRALAKPQPEHDDWGRFSWWPPQVGERR